MRAKLNNLTDLSSRELANVNIQAHVTSAHAPANAQKNSDILKAEIEAKLTGEITTHTHPATAANLSLTVRKISTATILDNTDNGKVILLTASCTVTIPNGLTTGFNVTFSTMAGATLTYAVGTLVVLINNVGTTMGEKLTHTIVNTGVANEYLTAGNI